MKRIFAEQINRSLSVVTAFALVVGTFGFALGAVAPSAFADATAPTTGAATSITTTDATLNGTNGDTAATDSSFWVSTSTFSTAVPVQPTGVYSTVGLGAQAIGAPYSAALSSATAPSGLLPITPNTTYYYAAWTEVGTTWTPGAVMSFTTGPSTLSGALVAQDFGTMDFSGVNGYTAGFGVTGTDLTGATSIVVQLYSGTTLLQTDTATTPSKFAGLTQFSSPFDVYGTFNYVTDGYWTNVRGTEYGQTLIPTKVIATVTLGNGKVVTATNSTLTGTPIVGPSVTTVAATGITSTNATLNGTNGTSAATDSSFWVATSTFTPVAGTNPTMPVGAYSTPSLGAQTAGANFSGQLSSISGILPITPNTTYYYVAWTEVGTTWTPGAVMSFTTSAAVTPVQPAVTLVAPATGSIAGGTSVTLTGVGFTGATSVLFGSTPATGVVVNSDSSITAIAPATSTAGIVDVTVTTPIGTSAIGTADQFTYAIGGTVTGGVIPGGVLNVVSITPVNTSGIADGTFADGWSYIFNITVPTTEPNLSMQFSNWLGANSATLPVAGNMQISSAQAVSAVPVLISAASTYSTPALDMVGSVSTSTPGLHVQVLVQVQIPLSTVNGSYTTNYGVQTLP